MLLDLFLVRFFSILNIQDKKYLQPCPLRGSVQSRSILEQNIEIAKVRFLNKKNCFI